MRTFILLFLISFSFSTYAQNSMWQWKEHLNYSQATDLIEKDGKLICSTSQGLFSYTLSTGEIETLTSLNGLNDANIVSMAYSETLDCIVLGYENGNIDLVFSDEIINVPDLKNTPNITGNKSILHINIDGTFAYLSSYFGIIKLNIAKKEISDTYYLEKNNGYKTIYSTAIYNDSLFAATAEGLFVGDKNHPFLSYYQNWEKLDFQNKLDSNSIISHIAATSDFLMFNRRIDTVYHAEQQFYYKDGHIDSLETSSIFQLKGLRTWKNKIYSSHDFFATEHTSLSEASKFLLVGELKIRQALKASDGSLWGADLAYGLAKQTGWKTYESFAPNGPQSDIVNRINYTKDGKMYMSHGKVGNSHTPQYIKKNFSVYQNNTWTYFPANDTLPELDITQMVADPFDPNKSWGSSWGGGLFEYENYILKTRYDTSNSELQPRPALTYQYLVADLGFDDQGTLWVLSSLSDYPLVSKTKDNVWAKYNFGSKLVNTARINRLSVFSGLNQKWITTQGAGIVVFDESQSGVKYKSLKAGVGNGNLESNQVNCATIDQNNKVWIGTDNGLSVLSSPRSIFNGTTPDANHVLVFFDGNWEPIFKGQNILDIEIDGANRKWFATTQGVYLTSADGTEQIRHFNTDNSPLLSNIVYDIAINQKTGEVFFATEYGVISYMSDAQLLEESSRAVLVFPNPVDPAYDGPITIDGLIANSNVKIADVSGRLVYQTISNGNRVVWDGKTLDGRAVESGVYIVYSALFENDQNLEEVAKFVIVR
ncbi:MAG: two-component regulator propeller domain-containing protein [Flavobacteriales bacterium]